MKTAVLRGSEHQILGGVSAIAEGDVAIALSRGGAPKRYPHKHPNEDAAAFAAGGGGLALAVADGHAGCEASALAVEHWLARFATRWTAGAAPGLGDAWSETAVDAMVALHRAILESRTEGGIESPRTTFATALVRPAEDLLAFASAGDSHIFRVDAAGAVDLAQGREGAPAFLGPPSLREGALRERCIAGTRGLSGVRALLLVTDGFSERGIGVEDPCASAAACVDRASGRARDLRPLEAARGAAEQALAAHRAHDSGDNVASAVAWLASGPTR